MKIFHGACHGCVQQDKHGVAYCAGCQNFEADWSKPDLFRKKSQPEKVFYHWRIKTVSKILHILFGI